MKYRRRRRVRSRAGRMALMSACIAIRGPSPRTVHTPAIPSTCGIFCSICGTVVSPSPFTIASTEPSACCSTSSVMKLMLWPPEKTKQSFSLSFVIRARSIISGTLGR